MFLSEKALKHLQMRETNLSLRLTVKTRNIASQKAWLKKELKDIEYVNRIKLIINRTKEEYANDETVDPSLLWEMVKMKVREESIKFGAHKKKQIAEKQEEIEQSIAFLEKNLAKVSTDDAVKQKMWSELETKKRELETIIEHQTKGALLRSKSRWYNEGEKNTKYFLNLEKRHCK